MGTIHLIPDPLRLEESFRLAESVGAAFEYNDFFDPALLDDREALTKRIGTYCALPRDRSRDTLHGAFYDVTVHSQDPLIREASRKRVRQSMECAEALGVRAVVFHTGTIPNFTNKPYEDNWVEENARFFREISADFPKIGILMENMFDMRPEMMAALSDRMAAVPQFGICLDWAHAAVFGSSFGNVKDWFTKLRPYLRHLHINDHDGLRDLHLPLGKGITDWSVFSESMYTSGISPSVLIEVSSLEAQRTSLQYMKENGIYPFSD